MKAQFRIYDRTCPGQYGDSPEEPSEDEVQRLLKLNRLLKQVGNHIREEAKDIQLRMEAELADPADPMVDYEIEAHLDCFLNESDPAYQEDADNILTSREVGVKNLDPSVMEWDWYRPTPPSLSSEPQSWLFTISTTIEIVQLVSTGRILGVNSKPACA